MRPRLDNVAAVWKLLNGRLEKNKVMYQLRVPLGEYSAGYKRYTIASQASKKSLSHHVSLPFGLSHDPTTQPNQNRGTRQLAIFAPTWTPDVACEHLCSAGT